jgi:hypothetical protein
MGENTGFMGTFFGGLPSGSLVNMQKTIEHDDKNSGFTQLNSMVI